MLRQRGTIELGLLALATVASAQSSGDESSSSKEVRHRAVVAHGILMGLAFAIFFPCGAIVAQLFKANKRNLVWFHAVWQTFSLIIAIAALGIGVWIAVTTDQLTASNGHPIIGIIVVAALFVQPFGGLLAHRLFAKDHHKTIWHYAHRWIGRVFLLLGAINGGLGLQLSGNTVKGEIAYGVLAGFFFLLWFIVWAIQKFTNKNTSDDEDPLHREKNASPANGRVDSSTATSSA